MNTTQHTDTAVLEFQNLGDALLTEVKPPEMLVRDLIYAEGIHSVYSPGGTGKTILAMWVALQALERCETVVYIDEENGSHHVTELLKHLGADNELVREYFKYAPAPGLTSAAANVWRATIDTYGPALVVFDSFADHLALEGLNENNSVEVTGWIKSFAQPVKDCGGAVLILDHVSKDRSGTGGARGSTAKLAKVDVAWRLTRTTPFSRDTIGKLTLSRDKDRIGTMPYSRTFRIGGDGWGTLTVEPDDIMAQPSAGTLTGKHRQIHDALINDFPNGSGAEPLYESIGMEKATFYRVVKQIPEDLVFKVGTKYHGVS
jgi:hypothetical protein